MLMSLRSANRRMICGAVAAIAVFGVATAGFADFLVDDLEHGTNKNKLNQYWYLFQYGTPALLQSDEFATTTEDANVGGTRSAVLSFSGLANHAGGAGMGTNISSSDIVGYGEAFNAVTGFEFYAKGPTGLVFHFDVETVEQGIAPKNDNAFGKSITISATGWQKYTINIPADIAQENWGDKYTFAKSKVTKVAWKIKGSDNASASTGKLYVDDIKILGTFEPSSAPPARPPYTFCTACVQTTVGVPAAVKSTLLADFEGTDPGKNKLGEYAYAYGSNVPAGTDPVYADMGRGGTGGASLSFTTAADADGNAFAGVGTNLGKPLDGSNFTGIYFEYKTPTNVDAVKFVVGEYTIPEAGGTEYHVMLKGTNGAWGAALVNYTDLAQPIWTPSAQKHPLNKADLSKLQFGFYDTVGVTGFIAIDNIYFVGDDKFLGQAEPTLPKYTLTYTASPISDGRIKVGDNPVGASDYTVSVQVEEGGTGPIVEAVPVGQKYAFDKWLEDGSTSSSRQDGPVTATSNKTFTAVFVAKPEYTVRYVAGEGGYLVVDGLGGARDSYSKALVAGEKTDSVSAVENEGYVFVKWSDDVMSKKRSDETSVDVAFTAIFEVRIEAVTVTYSAGAGGEIMVGDAVVPSPYVASLMPSQSSTVTVQPSAGYEFLMWSDGKTDTPRTDTYEGGTKAVTAAFKEVAAEPEPGVTKFNLTYFADEGGNVQKSGGIATKVFATEVTEGEDGPEVTAVDSVGYHFVEWSDGKTEKTRTDKATAALTVTAKFAPDGIDETYDISYTAGVGGKLMIGTREEHKQAFDTTVAYGGSAPAITAIADADYKFVKWSDGSTDLVRYNTDVRDDITLAAEFEPFTAVAANSRELPDAAAKETAVIAPITIVGGELTFGPNPASRQSGASVSFFRTGQNIKTGRVIIYDASGNLVKKLSLNDKGASGKRIVGSWDLKDRKNRPVAEGTYLVKGVVTTKSGAKEKVSSVIAVVR